MDELVRDCRLPGRGQALGLKHAFEAKAGGFEVSVVLSLVVSYTNKCLRVRSKRAKSDPSRTLR